MALAMAALITEHQQELTSVSQFLKYAQLDKKGDNYLELLTQAGLDEIQDVQEADDEMLSAAGMLKQFHRKRFLKLARNCTYRHARGVAGGDLEGADAEREELPNSLATMQAQMETLRMKYDEQVQLVQDLQQQLEGFLAKQPPSPPGTPVHDGAQDSVPRAYLFVSHSRRDAGALNAARMFARAMGRAVARHTGVPSARLATPARTGR